MKLKNSTEVTKDFHMKPLSSERSKTAPDDDNPRISPRLRKIRESPSLPSFYLLW